MMTELRVLRPEGRRTADRLRAEATIEGRALAARVTGLMREAQRVYLRTHPDGSRVILILLKTAYDDARRADREISRLSGPGGSAA